MPVKIKFLGGTEEVGRSAIVVKSGDSCLLLDYGVIVDHEPGFPMYISPRDLSAIVITHAHLDHCGAVPLFYTTAKIPVYGTKVTFDLCELLISDFIHLSGYYLPFEYIDLKSMLASARLIEYGKSEKIRDMEIKLLNAGHIPGSSQVLISAGKKKILYTSDFNLTNTRLLKGADIVEDEIDAVIIESTYANEEHPLREKLEMQLVDLLRDVVEKGGITLIPAFSVGRAQEILCILTHYNFEYPVMLDGMAREASKILEENIDYLGNPELFKKAIYSAYWIKGWKDRRKALKKPCVIIAPAGMLKGGAAVFYAQKIAKNEKNAIVLVSFQIPGTPGRELLDRGVFIIDGKTRKVNASVYRFDFSSHCGRSQLLEAVKKIRGSPVVYTVHGAEGNCALLANLIKEEVGVEVVVPKAGEVYAI